jgi:uncharacterized protein YkwD
LVVRSLAVRVRRPLLPALTAVLAGALVAGTATVLGGPAAETSADQGDVSVALTNERRPDSNDRPAQSSSATTTVPPSSSVPSTTDPPPPPPAPPPTVTETTTAAPPPTSEAPANTSAQDQVVALVNTARGNAGCGPVTADANLTAAAQAHASDMAARDYFEHTTPEGVTFDQRIRNAGYSQPGAENIARGAETAERVMAMWMESPGHRDNILNCDLATIGVGLDTNGFYWVQNFGF